MNLNEAKGKGLEVPKPIEHPTEQGDVQQELSSRHPTLEEVFATIQRFEPTGNLDQDTITFLQITDRASYIPELESGRSDPTDLLSQLLAFERKELGTAETRLDADSSRERVLFVREIPQAQVTLVEKILAAARNNPNPKERRAAPLEAAEISPRVEKLKLAIEDGFRTADQKQLEHTERIHALYEQQRVLLREITEMIPELKVDGLLDSLKRNYTTLQATLAESRANQPVFKERLLASLTVMPANSSERVLSSAEQSVQEILDALKKGMQELDRMIGGLENNQAPSIRDLSGKVKNVADLKRDLAAYVETTGGWN